MFNAKKNKGKEKIHDSIEAENAFSSLTTTKRRETARVNNSNSILIHSRSTDLDKSDEEFISSKNTEALKESSQDETEDLFIYPEDPLFAKGILRQSLFMSVSSQRILTDNEEAQIKNSKKKLSIIINKFEAAKKKYLSHIKKISESSQLLLVAKKNCTVLRKKALGLIIFLDEMATRLLYATQIERAILEFNAILNFSKKILGESNLETLKIQMNYAISLCAREELLESNAKLLEETVKQIASAEDFPSPEDKSRYLAVGYSQLAQSFISLRNFSKASKYLDQSERLRKEYNASSSELDKVNLLRGKIEFEKGNNIKALNILLKCYNFRNSQNQFNTELIPVLKMLIQIMDDEKHIGDEMVYLSHLLALLKHNQCEIREIIQIQLKMLRVMALHAPEEEFWDVLSEIENHLESLPVTKESKDVGLNYMSLAKTRSSNLLPSEWSNAEKQHYHIHTLKLIAKAELHLTAANCRDSSIRQDLNRMKHDCELHINYFDDPYAGKLIGEPLHPEDVPLDLSPEQHEENMAETNTQEELKALSEFSSEVRHSQVDESDRLLTVEDFELLPNEGKINPNKLRTAQGGINPKFRDGKTLEETKELLSDNPDYTKKIPPVEIGIYNGKVYSFDTRRLITHQQAKEINKSVYIRYKKISGEYLEQRIEAIFSSRPWNGIVTAMRYEGKNSPSEAYINPVFRTQLEKKVQRTFKRYPNQRDEGSDPNGFPIKMKRAQKIYTFFQEKEKAGSENAKRILKETRQIRNEQGDLAVFDFLIDQKLKLKEEQDNSKRSLHSTQKLVTSASTAIQSFYYHDKVVPSSLQSQNGGINNAIKNLKEIFEGATIAYIDIDDDMKEFQVTFKDEKSSSQWKKQLTNIFENASTGDSYDKNKWRIFSSDNETIAIKEEYVWEFIKKIIPERSYSASFN